MSAHRKEDWLRDVNARQRNVVFPDTAENEGRFWRNIVSGKESLTLAQWIGILLFCLCIIGLLASLWPKGGEVWWQKLIDGYTILIVLTAGLVAFIVIGNRRARHKRYRR
jgi:hypothetical protein